MDLGALAGFGVWDLGLGLRSGSRIWVWVCRGLCSSIPQHSCHQLSLSTVPCVAGPDSRKNGSHLSLHSLLSLSPPQPLCPGPAALCRLSEQGEGEAFGVGAGCNVFSVPPCATRPVPEGTPVPCAARQRVLKQWLCFLLHGVALDSICSYSEPGWPVLPELLRGTCASLLLGGNAVLSPLPHRSSPVGMPPGVPGN